ncbi:MAG: ribonuclease Z [Mangrovibacterium sp.]
MQAPFNLTILGSSAALPTSEKFPTAQVLNALGRLFLIDCGEGTQHQLRANKISVLRIDQILISHLHGDHFFGLIGLLSSMSLLGRTKDLHLYAHSKIKEYIDFHTFFLDHNELSFKIVYHPLNFKNSQIIFENKKLVVRSFPLKHSIPTCGFRFDEKPKPANIIKEQISRYEIPLKEVKFIKDGADFVCTDGRVIPNEKLIIPAPAPRSYAYCSDTAYSPNIIEEIRDVNLLYHEATFLDKDRLKAINTQHSTSMEAALIAKSACVSKLLIGHFSARYHNTEILLDEAKSVFKHAKEAKENCIFKIGQ